MVAVVLAVADAGGVERLDRLEQLVVLPAKRLRIEAARRLHRDEAEHVEEMRHDHVAERAGLLVEPGPAFDGEVLGYVDWT